MNLPQFQLVVPAPDNPHFAGLAAQCDEEKILSIDYLLPNGFNEAMENCRKTPLTAGQKQLVGKLEPRLCAYFKDAESGCARFNELLPYLGETPTFPKEVRDAIFAIPCGEVNTYGDTADDVNPSFPCDALEMGEYCGNNPFAVVIPCCRVIAARFRLHHFGHNAYVEEECKDQGKDSWAVGRKIKRWFLEHEGCTVDGDNYDSTVIPRHG